MLLYEFYVQGYKIEVWDTLVENNLVSQWGEVTNGTHHLRPEMLVLLETAKPQDLRFRYLFIYESEESKQACGIIYLQQLNFNHRNFNFEKKGILHYLALFILKFTSFRVLLAGSLFAVDFSPISVKGNKPNRQTLLSILEGYSKLEKHDIFVLKDLPLEFDKTLLSNFGYNSFETDLTMQLEINPSWKTFDDYEKALTHKYAQRVKKVRRQGSKLVRKQMNREDFLHHKVRLMDLFEQVARKQTIRMGIIDHVYFEEIFETLGKDFIFIGYFQDEELIAFSSHICYAEKLEVHYIGIDYTKNKQFSLYFNILYDGIILSMKHSKKSLELGRTAREAKAVVGCHPIYFNDYLKIRNKLTSWLLELLSKYFNKGLGEGWKKRHPFKTIATAIGG